MNIISNHQWRNFLYWYELPEKAKADLDYASEDEAFLKYKGNYYALNDFMRGSLIEGWHGHSPDSFFSGVLIRLSDDGYQYQIGRYYS